MYTNNEFEFLIDNEEDETTFEEDSKIFVEEAKSFISKSAKYPDVTYQGICVCNIADRLSIGESDIVPWEHVSMTIDVSKMRTVGFDRLKELCIPTFVEEVCSIGDKNDSGFGYNEVMRNDLKYIKIPKSTIVIAPNTFCFYKKLETIEFENNNKLIYLGKRAFAYCEKLHTVDLRTCVNLDKLEDCLFEGSGVEVLKINSNIKTIGNIKDNTRIKTVYVDDEKYTFENFIRLLEDNGSKSFWEAVDFDF